MTDRELCANITIRKGATDRRSVPYKSITKNNCFVWTRGGYFFMRSSLDVIKLLTTIIVM